MKNIATAVIAISLAMHASSVCGQIKKIWLTHKTDQPSHIVINWESSQPGNSEVFFGPGSAMQYHIRKDENVRLHHIEIPLEKKDTMYQYMVKTGKSKSEKLSFKSYPMGELRVVIVGNWGFAGNVDFSHMLNDNPHLLLTCGDNISELYQDCDTGINDCVEPFLKLVASAPAVFNSIPFMPSLGNHDKQIRERGKKAATEPVYDTNATAYKNFVELPGDEWKWMFRIPELNVNFISLDLNHVGDLRPNYQSSRNHRVTGEQFIWYRKLMENRSEGFYITISNESNTIMRKLEKGAWNELLRKGTAVIAGFGHYLERAEVDGVPYFNTSLKSGDIYPDDFAKITKGMPGYILLTFRKNQPMVAQIKSLDGKLIDQSEWPASR